MGPFPEPEGPPPEASIAEHVIGERCGDVLIKHTLLKADHFPGA